MVIPPLGLVLGLGLLGYTKNKQLGTKRAQKSTCSYCQRKQCRPPAIADRISRFNRITGRNRSQRTGFFEFIKLLRCLVYIEAIYEDVRPATHEKIHIGVQRRVLLSRQKCRYGCQH